MRLSENLYLPSAQPPRPFFLIQIGNPEFQILRLERRTILKIIHDSHHRKISLFIRLTVPDPAVKCIHIALFSFPASGSPHHLRASAICRFVLYCLNILSWNSLYPIRTTLSTYRPRILQNLPDAWRGFCHSSRPNKKNYQKSEKSSWRICSLTV